VADLEDTENLTYTGIRFPDRPARSEMLSRPNFCVVTKVIIRKYVPKFYVVKKSLCQYIRLVLTDVWTVDNLRD